VQHSASTKLAKLPGQGHVPAGLLRISVGCEHVEDLWADLAAALAADASNEATHAAGQP
jgi:cystathionine gamma-synthase